MSFRDQLTDTIEHQLSTVTQPAPDLPGAVRRGRRIRRRRSLVAFALPVAAVTVLTAVALGTAGTESTPPEAGSGPEKFAPVGMLDYSEGLRAFASPDADGQVSIGGKSFPVKDKGYLDTDATATPFGLVFFDRAGQAHLLAQDGTDRTLAPAPTRKGAHVRLSAKADVRLPLVAFTQPGADGVAVLLSNLDTARPVDRIDVPCAGSECEKVRVDALDQGLVFVRTGAGTFVWDPDARQDAQWTLLGKGAFRVADARDGHVLWSAAPAEPAADSPVSDWKFIRGEIDAELSHDGRHVLYWSARLKPTTPAGRTIELSVKDAIWFAFDTDGSVLAAVGGVGQRSTVYDCELPSGACERIGSVSTNSGDPMFIGTDM
jgi:hypothetical protein